MTNYLLNIDTKSTTNKNIEIQTPDAVSHIPCRRDKTIILEGMIASRQGRRWAQNVIDQLSMTVADVGHFK
uniref:Uncharacterized protein n=1 Tax=Arion vulgaris TaxID=1028688 RepID=A0A0B7BXK1_9EUPU